MRKRILLAGQMALLLAAAWPIQAAEPTTKFFAKSGSKMRIEGTANMLHTHWAVESTLIGGSLEVGPGFPCEPGQAATPGKVDARADVFIAVRSLKSVEANGQHYSDRMDDIMYEKLLPTNAAPKITYHLTDLSLKEVAKSKDEPYGFEAKGDLVVAGVTNPITMPAKVLPLADKKLKISGVATVRMTDFKIEPPVVKLIGLKTGDDVKLIFDWMVIQKPAQPATATK